MRFPRRPFAPFLAVAALAAGLGALAASCGTDAVGIDACKQIEIARCDEAPACKADFDVPHCEAFYRDQCLHGIENADHSPSDQEVSDCVGAIKDVAACARRGAGNMKDCAVPLVDTVLPATISPCDVLMSNAHLLQKCAFAATGTDAGAVTTTPATDAAADAGDAAASDASAADAAADASTDAG